MNHPLAISRARIFCQYHFPPELPGLPASFLQAAFALLNFFVSDRVFADAALLGSFLSHADSFGCCRHWIDCGSKWIAYRGHARERQRGIWARGAAGCACRMQRYLPHHEGYIPFDSLFEVLARGSMVAKEVGVSCSLNPHPPALARAEPRLRGDVHVLVACTVHPTRARVQHPSIFLSEWRYPSSTIQRPLFEIFHRRISSWPSTNLPLSYGSELERRHLLHRRLHRHARLQTNQWFTWPLYRLYDGIDSYTIACDESHTAAKKDWYTSKGVAAFLCGKIREVRRQLDTAANREELCRLKADLAAQGPYSMRKVKLVEAIEELQRRIDSIDAYRESETLLAELQFQQLHENEEISEYPPILIQTPSPMQTLLPELLAEIFLHVWRTPSMVLNWSPLTSEMSDLLKMTRVCSSWRAAALGTPALWCELSYSDYVPLDLHIWPYFGYGTNEYWQGAMELLHTQCAKIGALTLRLPVRGLNLTMPPLFPPPYHPTSLRWLVVTPYDDFIHKTLVNIPWSQLSHLQLQTDNCGRYVSSTHGMALLSQAQNLIYLSIDLSPDIAHHVPVSTRRLALLNLHTLDLVSSLPVGLLDHLYVPSLKSLSIRAREGSDLVDQCLLPFFPRFPDHRVHKWSRTSSADTIVLFQEMLSLSTLHLLSYASDFSALVVALTYTHGNPDGVLLPNLQNVSLSILSKNNQIPGLFAAMVASQWWPKDESNSYSVSRLRSFHLESDDNVPTKEYSEETYLPSPLTDQAWEENECAVRCLTSFTKEGLHGHLRCHMRDSCFQMDGNTPQTDQTEDENEAEDIADSTPTPETTWDDDAIQAAASVHDTSRKFDHCFIMKQVTLISLPAPPPTRKFALPRNKLTS
ncbi:hypothetical protein B0H10DRAFT_1938227 [Mycena sp. CBHHK59/15]|nr:hypothetical protein B0H10DRAFT_1938227 [Mycena sp. CBHHK59/15]